MLQIGRKGQNLDTASAFRTIQLFPAQAGDIKLDGLVKLIDQIVFFFDLFHQDSIITLKDIHTA